MDYQTFFQRDAETVAKNILGRQLIRIENGQVVSTGKILQTAAYSGGKMTPIRQGMLYAPGTIFIMPFRGLHFLNITTLYEDEPSCVLIRQVSADKILDGPGKVGKFFNVASLDGIVIGQELQLKGESVDLEIITVDVTEAPENCFGYYGIE